VPAGKARVSGAPPQPFRVILASGARGLLVDALGVVLEQRDDVELIADPVHSMDEAVDACVDAPLGAVLVLDTDGSSPSKVIEFLRMVRGSCDGTKVLLLLTPGTEHDVLVIEYVEAGADGFVHRASDIGGVVAAIRAAAIGETVIDRDTFVDLLRRAGNEREAARRAAHLLRTLTPREFEILHLVTDGSGNDDIGGQLGISARTVATHVQNIFRKLEVHSRLQAIALLNRTGVLDEMDLHQSPER
jgi:DNA-binding NarL/FixJ family response regulator